MINIIVPFKRWIKKYRDECSLRGDLANDVWGDDRFPYRSQSYHVIRSHLVGMAACEIALDTFEDTWNQYQKEAK